MSEIIQFDVDENGIAVLCVNRPQARNALNWAAQDGFMTAVDTVASSAAVRVLIITGKENGQGRQAFVSGGDLKELNQDVSVETGKRLNSVMSAALNQLTQLPIPVIAAVNGDAFGGGCEIVTACDLRLASEAARFSFAQVRVGLVTGWGGTARFINLIGQSRAMELLLTGRVFDAAEAQRLGFVHRVLPSDQPVLAAAQDWAAELIRLPRHALAAMKSLVYAGSAPITEDIAKKESQLFLEMWGAADHLEALDAFTKKRRAVFDSG